MKRFLGAGVLLLAATLAVAQDQPRQGGRPFGGGFGGPGGGGATFLLASSEVQKELSLTDEQKKKITEIGENTRKELQGSFSREEFQKLSDEERRKRFDELRKKGEESSAKALTEVGKVLDPKQNERFGQLRLQSEGIRALGKKDVADKLDLNGDQREEIEKILQAARSSGGGFGGFGGSAEERRAAFEKAQKAREKTDADLQAVLTPEQKSKWDKMLGAKFEFPNRGFGPPGGGQPGGRGGQRPPQNNDEKKNSDEKK